MSFQTSQKAVVLPVVSAQIHYRNVMNSIYANNFYFSRFLQKNSFLFIDFASSKLFGALREHHVFLDEFVKNMPWRYLASSWFCQNCQKKLSNNLIDLIGLNVVELRETVENFIDVSDHG